MYIPDDLDDCKNAECNINSTIGSKVELPPEMSADRVGNPAAAFLAMRLAVADPGGQADRLRNLTGCFREHVAAHRRWAVDVVLRAIGTEHFYVALAAVQNYPLIEYGYTIYNAGVCGQRTEYVYAYIEEKGHIYRIKAPVKWYRLQIKEHGNDISASEPDVCRMLNQVVLIRWEINP